MPGFFSWVKSVSQGALCSRPQIIFESMREVEDKAKYEKKVLIVYKDDVYDVTGYIDAHPGGKEIMVLANFKMVDKLFDKYHYPLGEAPGIMKKYKIGHLRANWYKNKEEHDNLAKNVD